MALFPLSDTAYGSSMDWALSQKTDNSNFISLAYEMRPDFSNQNGFVLPGSDIVPAGQEFRESLLTAARCYDEIDNDDDDKNSRCKIKTR